MSLRVWCDAQADALRRSDTGQGRVVRRRRSRPHGSDDRQPAVARSPRTVRALRLGRVTRARVGGVALARHRLFRNRAGQPRVNPRERHIRLQLLTGTRRPCCTAPRRSQQIRRKTGPGYPKTAARSLRCKKISATNMTSTTSAKPTKTSRVPVSPGHLYSTNPRPSSTPPQGSLRRLGRPPWTDRDDSRATRMATSRYAIPGRAIPRCL